MQTSEMAELLTAASQVDRWVTATEGSVVLWWSIAGHLSLPDAMVVLRQHYATHTTSLMPAHLIEGVARLRSARIAELGTVDEYMADVPPDHPQYDGIRADRIRAAADGRDRPALPPAPPQERPGPPGQGERPGPRP